MDLFPLQVKEVAEMARAGSEQRAELSFLPPPLILVSYFPVDLATMDFIILVEEISFCFMKMDRYMLLFVLLKHTYFSILVCYMYTY